MLKEIKHNIIKFGSKFIPLTTIKKMVPVKKIVSFASFPDYSDNARAFYDYLIEQKDKQLFNEHRFVWHVEDPGKMTRLFPDIEFVKLHSLKSILLFLESDYVIKTHGLYESLGSDARRKVVLLFHGMTVKKIGYQNPDDVQYGVLQADYYAVTSAFYKRVFQECFRAEPDQVLVTGMPRNDVLFHLPAQIHDTIKRKIGERVIVFLPTFRKCTLRDTEDGQIGSSNECFGGNRKEWESLDWFLTQCNQKLVIKPHPMDGGVNNEVIQGLKNVVLIDDNWLSQNNVMLYQLLAYSDKLITDYSSVFIDYLLLDKPICFFMPDYQDYLNTRGLIFEKPLEWLPGNICQQFGEIADFITGIDRFQPERMRVNNILNEIHDGSASANLLRQLDLLEMKNSI